MDVDQRVCMRPIVQKMYNWTRGSLCIQITPVNILPVFVDNTSGYASSLLHSTCLAQVILSYHLSHHQVITAQTGKSCILLPAYFLHFGRLCKSEQSSPRKYQSEESENIEDRDNHWYDVIHPKPPCCTRANS